MFLRLICFFNSWETYFHNLIFHIIAGDSDAESISSRDSSESAISLPSSPEQKRKIKRADTRTASLLVIKNNFPRSNQIAERAVKLMEELHKKTKNLEYLNLKFIVNNNF